MVGETTSASNAGRPRLPPLKGLFEAPSPSSGAANEAKHRPPLSPTSHFAQRSHSDVNAYYMNAYGVSGPGYGTIPAAVSARARGGSTPSAPSTSDGTSRYGPTPQAPQASLQSPGTNELWMNNPPQDAPQYRQQAGIPHGAPPADMGALANLDHAMRQDCIDQMINSIDLQRSLRTRVDAKEGRPACDECRRRKVKCDRHTPCGRCVAHQRPCTLNDTLMRRGPLTREQRAVFAYTGISYESHRERTKKRRLLAEAAKAQEQVMARNVLEAYQQAQSSPVFSPLENRGRRSSLATAQKGLDSAVPSYVQSKLPPSIFGTQFVANPCPPTPGMPSNQPVASGLPMSLLFGPNPIPSPIEAYPMSNGATISSYHGQRRSDYARRAPVGTAWPGYSVDYTQDPSYY